MGSDAFSRRGQLGMWALAIAVSAVAGAAFPRMVHRLRWWRRVGGRGIVAYVVFNTLLGFALRQALAHFKRWAEEQQAMWEELKERLDRDPTTEELMEHFAAHSSRR